MKLFIVLLIVVSNLAHSTVLDKCKAFENDLSNLILNKKAFDVSELEKCIAKGEISNSEHYLGLIYFHGMNVPKDYKKGITYLFNSANKGYLNSIVALGEIYIIDTDKDIFNQGVLLLELAMDKGDKGSVVTLFSMMNFQKIPHSEKIESQFNSLVQTNYGEAILYKVTQAVSKAIELDSEEQIKDIISELNFAKIDMETKGKVHYLIARAYISEGTSFYSIPSVKSELEKASEFGHEEAQKLLVGIKKQK